MGLHFLGSHSSYDYQPCDFNSSKSQPALPNPDPKNFDILDKWEIGRYLILSVRYPDCTNYEGNKILLYENVTLERLLAQGSLDPHFSESVGYFSPIARFAPTERCLRMAMVLARLLSGERQNEDPHRLRE
jgi:hypothetical protein